MTIYLNSTSNLGDFLNAMPVLSGISKKYGKIDFVIRSDMKKFKGIKEFLLYQNIFNSVEFDDDIFMNGVITLSSWTREDKNDKNRPTETCRYENWLKDRYAMLFEVDDEFEIQFPKLDISIDTNNYYVGDRWNDVVDTRRKTNVLSYLDKMNFIDYNKTLLENCYIIKNSPKPFITNLTGVSVLADLLNKESYIVWKPEDWNQEFQNGDDVNWDNGKGINEIFAKHFYANRKMKLVKSKDLKKLL